MTVPSTSIASFLATGLDASLSHGECRSKGTDTRTRSVSEMPLFGQIRRPRTDGSPERRLGPRSASADPGIEGAHSDRCQDFRTVVRYRDRVLEMGRQGTV